LHELYFLDYCHSQNSQQVVLLFENTLLFGLEQRKRVVAEISILRHKSVEIGALQQRFVALLS
jgi:hypothetical protein